MNSNEAERANQDIYDDFKLKTRGPKCYIIPHHQLGFKFVPLQITKNKLVGGGGGGAF